MSQISPPAGPPSAADEFRSLRRSRSDRVIAGVLGGLGHRIGIDPLVLRITTVVLAIFGGVGVLLYAVAWLLVPAEDEDASVLDQGLGRGGSRSSSTSSTLVALALAALVVAAGVGVVAGSWDSAVLLVLAVCGLVALMRRRADDDETSTPTAPEQAWFDAPGSSAAPLGPPAASWPEGPDWTVPAEPAAEPKPPPSKQNSPLGPITFCAALVTVGVLAACDVTWATVPAGMYIAAPLAVVGLGLLAGAWFGRSRGLIALGLLLSLALLPVAWLSQWELANSGSVSHRFTNVSQVPEGVQSHGGGDVRYDLSGLVLTDRDTVRLSVEQGAGDLDVVVPPTADVQVNASVGAGDLQVFGASRDGLGPSLDVNDNGTDGPGGGTIVLDLNLGAGDLEVTR